MYKVLIADDEPEVLDGLKILIEWDKYGFKVAGTAANGKEALNKLNEDNYDLVVTDIRMPMLNGLELIKAIHGVDAELKIIILSGYDEFSYAKSAVELGVKAYLLKPVDQKELQHHLINIKNELDNLYAKKRISDQKDKIIREKFLYDLTEGNVTEQELHIKGEEFDIHLRDGCFCIALLEIENFYCMLEESIDHAKAMLAALGGITEKMITGRQMGYIYEDLQGLIGIIFSGRIFEREEIEDCLKEICLYSLNRLNLHLIVGVGNIFAEIENIKLSKKQARKALERKCFVNNGNIIFYDKFELSEKLAWQMEENYSVLIDAIEEMNIDIINAQKGKIIKDIQNKHLPNEVIQALSYSLMFGICTIVKKYKRDAADLLNQIDVLTLSSSNIEKFKEWLDNTCLRAVDYISRISGIKSDKIAVRIKKYIEDNFSEDISLKMMADVFYLNPAYLGQLFKNSFGESFSDYLNKKRISQAKKMIFIEGYKIYDAIKNAGYKNTEYFYRQFRRYENISFAEYREKLKVLK